MKRIIFLDLDGTLWDRGKIPRSAIRAIRQAQKNGNKVFLNTGRARSEINSSILQLGLNGYCFSAGTDIEAEGRPIFYHPLKDAQEIEQRIKTLGYRYAMEGSQQSFANSQNVLLQHLESKPPVTAMRAEDYRQIMKIAIHSHRHFDDEIRAVLPDDLKLTRFGRFGGEITDARFNKGTAIDTVESYYGDAYLSIACGDSDNDLPMFLKSDVSVAMGNADPVVKQQVDHVTDPVGKEGLYKAFMQLEII
ncbi:HAD-IIB family hydrolase [Catenisphaera adipataccumulans]|jgi:Cof subfamily protein (haloacid dehalogenase superfamily)|uniref:Uncharacterized protein n=1 Tax=Catenisphaera adipataccumulans TaxID=700500 RepID=A0A7W8FVP4_9FIRM|nr:HAD-IIB family hydrolase [Catenisphaera adipataccumulans]MBB5183368.1 hypothetical protein [Catenisphaera adipataccumulans]